ncbi:MAG: glucosamine-6-phosphate deaminase [Calditrichaeota bacterium]|nr:MAG: glucosamine-6-phosphate deaminase [Calditrichota bacterium]
MEIIIAASKDELGKKAAACGAGFIRNAIAEFGEANIIVATGASQFEMLSYLIQEQIDWSAVTGFHLDEYIGLPASHPASFRKYLNERFVNQVPLKDFIYVEGDKNPATECERLNKLLITLPIDVAFIGIGENGHLAFNDPPADFSIEDPFITVTLDAACRRQQMGEGWFVKFDDVPEKAISMSIQQILKAKNIICSVSDRRKANAVKKSIESAITPDVPATILQKHASVQIFLDQDSASLLNQIDSNR